MDNQRFKFQDISHVYSVQVELINPITFGDHKRSYIRCVVTTPLHIEETETTLKLSLAPLGLKTKVIPLSNIVTWGYECHIVPKRDNEHFVPYPETNDYCLGQYEKNTPQTSDDIVTGYLNYTGNFTPAAPPLVK